MKATAIAPANIAFIKYWGKKDAKLRLPYNPSISMNLSSCITTTTVEFSKEFQIDTVTEGFNPKRVIEHIDRLRALSGINDRVRVTTANNFPSSSGIASSASGFAALTVAAADALGLHLSERKLTELARLGSGSACRSIPDGFVKWDGEFAYSIYPPDYWDILDILVIVGKAAKSVSSSEGHENVETSPLFAKRLAALPGRFRNIELAMKNKDFSLFGKTIEEECLDMHHVMQTQDPPLFYWTRDTQGVIDDIKMSGVPAYFTVDAGPNVHIICEGKDEARVRAVLSGREIIVNKPAKGAHSI